jgi:hypothetical protein
MAGELHVAIEPWGPAPDAVREAAEAAVGDARLLSAVPLDETRILATAYDDAQERTLLIELGDGEPVVTSSSRQPSPTPEERAAAVEVLREDPELGPGLAEGRVRAYRSMPPIVPGEREDGTVERTLTVGLKGQGVHEIVGVHLGRRVLTRAHVPILNVRYDRDACGPFRDWQNEESRFQIQGSAPAPGSRLCTAQPTTILESESDHGNFAGVAVWVDGDEVELVSELEAGWYRYVSRWRLGADGRIKARFGFGAVSNSCVCNTHHRHVYWRFDFDIGGAADDAVLEFNGAADRHQRRPLVRRPFHARRRARAGGRAPQPHRRPGPRAGPLVDQCPEAEFRGHRAGAAQWRRNFDSGR